MERPLLVFPRRYGVQRARAGNLRVPSPCCYGWQRNNEKQAASRSQAAPSSSCRYTPGSGCHRPRAVGVIRKGAAVVILVARLHKVQHHLYSPSGGWLYARSRHSRWQGQAGAFAEKMPKVQGTPSSHVGVILWEGERPRRRSGKAAYLPAGTRPSFFSWMFLLPCGRAGEPEPPGRQNKVWRLRPLFKHGRLSAKPKNSAWTRFLPFPAWNAPKSQQKYLKNFHRNSIILWVFKGRRRWACQSLTG